jgi:prevent-host-death family protein
MKIVPLAELKARLSAYVDEAVTQGPLVITRSGRPVAVLVVPEDDDDLERLVLSRSPRFRAALQRSRRSIAAGRGLSEKEFWQAVDEQERTSQTSG